jgi:hypothetical protein
MGWPKSIVFGQGSKSGKIKKLDGLTSDEGILTRSILHKSPGDPYRSKKATEIEDTEE